MVETNRRLVHEGTKGGWGMCTFPHGAARVFRVSPLLLSEIDREGLVVDVRFNGGGHVSELILEKTARRALLQPIPLVQRPTLSRRFRGGADGGHHERVRGLRCDIFSHGFKLLKLGPLIGKRTWGGVIGIWPRHSLIDAVSHTAGVFVLVPGCRWKVENYGTDRTLKWKCGRRICRGP